MASNTDTIERFYRTFQLRDHEAMAECYHPSIHFSDPMFSDLRGSEVAAMWHMLCERATDLDVTLNGVTDEGDGSLSAQWEARYPFGRKARSIHNKIDARFVFEDGKIIEHVDEFSLWRWTRMAFGVPALLTGWTGSVQAKVRARAARSLTKFIEDHPEYQ